MAASVTHTKVSTIPPTDDSDLISSDDWNDSHTVAISAADVGAETAGAVATHAALSDPHTGYRLESATIDTGDITNDAVTYAKLQNVSATSRILGRITTGAGDAEELSATNVKTILAMVASDVAFTPYGTVAASNLQSALQEMLDETMHHVPPFSKQGTVATATGAGRWYNDTGRTLTFVSARASVGTAPTGATLICDINVDGTTIMTGTKVVIATSGNTIKQTTFSTATIADGSYITVDVDQVGSTIPGSDLVLQILLRG